MEPVVAPTSDLGGNHRGKRFGHCSNKPNTNRIALPTITARTMMTMVAVSLLMPSSTPKIADTMSVKRSRRHAKMRAKPVGAADATEAIGAAL